MQIFVNQHISSTLRSVRRKWNGAAITEPDRTRWMFSLYHIGIWNTNKALTEQRLCVCLEPTRRSREGFWSIIPSNEKFMLSKHLILLQFCNLYVQNYFINSLEWIISLERLDAPPSFSFLHPSLCTTSSKERNLWAECWRADICRIHKIC